MKCENGKGGGGLKVILSRQIYFEGNSPHVDQIFPKSGIFLKFVLKPGYYLTSNQSSVFSSAQFNQQEQRYLNSEKKNELDDIQKKEKTNKTCSLIDSYVSNY